MEQFLPGGNGPDLKLKAHDRMESQDDEVEVDDPHVYDLVYAQGGILDSIQVGDLEPDDEEDVVATYFDPRRGCYSICTRHRLLGN
jgi:hypothetical protein